jgi:hypothetical protein
MVEGLLNGWVGDQTFEFYGQMFEKSDEVVDCGDRKRE